MEKLVAIRRSLIASARERESNSIIGDLTTPQLDVLQNLEKRNLLHVSRTARVINNLQAANNATTIIRRIENGDLSHEAEDEFGQVLWAQKEHALSIQHLEQRIEAIHGKSGKQYAILRGQLVSPAAPCPIQLMICRQNGRQ